MAAIGLTTFQQEGVFQTIAAILHLGNIAFTDASCDGSATADEASGTRVEPGAQEAVEVAAELLGVDPILLVTVLTTRTIQAREGGSGFRVLYEPTGTTTPIELQKSSCVLSNCCNLQCKSESSVLGPTRFYTTAVCYSLCFLQGVHKSCESLWLQR